MFSVWIGQPYFWSHQHQNKHNFPDMVSGYSPFNVSNQTAVLMLFLLFPNPFPTFHTVFKGSLSVVPCETFLHQITVSEWWFAFSSVIVLHVHLCKVNSSLFMNAVKLFFHKPTLVFHLWPFPGKMEWQRVSQEWLGNSSHFCWLCLHQTSLIVHTHPQAYIFYSKFCPTSEWKSKGLHCPVTHLPNAQEKNLALTFNKWMDYIANNKMAKYRHDLWIKHCLTLHDANLFWHILIIALWLCPSECFLIVQWLSFAIQLLATVKYTVVFGNMTYTAAHTHCAPDMGDTLWCTLRQTAYTHRWLHSLKKKKSIIQLLKGLEILCVMTAD